MYTTQKWMSDKTLNFTASRGFEVQNILVEGRQHTDPDALMAILNVRKGDPLFGFSPAPAQEMIEKLSWVKSVHVQRRLPDTVYVKLTEREPYALWQQNKKLQLIDREGSVLTAHRLERFSNLLIVTGQNAPTRVSDIVDALAFEPDIQSKIESASLISDRRWDLNTKNGIRIRLPEEEIGFALRRLAHAHTQSGILDKNIMAIDLRDSERMVVQTKPGAVQDYRTEFTPAAGSPI